MEQKAELSLNCLFILELNNKNYSKPVKMELLGTRKRFRFREVSTLAGAIVQHSFHQDHEIFSLRQDSILKDFTLF